jgi:UDP-3-O-[3-hydroxymyristoyl] N-acetylglucosamine deacetylase / 3-hydroxyacyl-[acyl-carrier-protein] dehydratase
MDIKRQLTLRQECSFEGKGLHTGKYARLTVKPAPENTGIVFQRVDLGSDAFVEALAENVSNTARSTTICKDGVCVITIEHLMSALTGVGVDNAIIEIDNEEVPILDGSARFFTESFLKAGLKVQKADRVYINLTEDLEISDPETGSYIKFSPSDKPSYDVTVDFNSKVLGIQKVHWDLSVDYATQIGCCRTFVFFHEIEFLFQNNLVKGGDLDNAIVIVEHPASEEQVNNLTTLFNCPDLKVTGHGYLNNLKLHFDDECGRHKLLDLIGDLRLAGGYVNAKIVAFKPGHKLNTQAAKAIRNLKK